MVCVKYRRERYNKWVRIWDEWKPIELWDSPWRYFIGNCMTFGFWSGLKANITLLSPLANKLWNWKYRNHHLDIHLPKGHHLELVKTDEANK